MAIISVEKAILAVKRGEPIIIFDSQGRENEGDVMIAAQAATPEKLNFCIQEAKGLMCVPLSRKRCEEMEIPLMVSKNTDHFHTPFTVSVDARKGTTTGMSVADRMETLRVLLADSSTPSDLNRPGHLFPLMAHPDGVLGREGHTEAAVDLCRLAGLKEIAVIAEVMSPDGSMARLSELLSFAHKHGLVTVSVDDLVRHRKQAGQQA
ncbi:TPA: 3,4-dihydroxy-2-butanone-4-phosphate synthase [Candidatus Woesearchaeota archaeon]|nr:3,4-dihydroxy-2-butanone-4-phosphate synthase [Candidatus Woesearchaeota archaeon]